MLKFPTFFEQNGEMMLWMTKWTFNVHIADHSSGLKNHFIFDTNLVDTGMKEAEKIMLECSTAITYYLTSHHIKINILIFKSNP